MFGQLPGQLPALPQQPPQLKIGLPVTARIDQGGKHLGGKYLEGGPIASRTIGGKGPGRQARDRVALEWAGGFNAPVGSTPVAA